MTEPRPEYYDVNGVKIEVEGYEDKATYYANQLTQLEIKYQRLATEHYQLQGQYSQATIQLGRYRYALRVIAGISDLPQEYEFTTDTEPTFALEMLQEYATKTLKQYDDHTLE